MGDPTRLCSAESDADEAERALLSDLRERGPSAEQRAALWRELATGVVTAGVVAAAAPASAGVTSTGAFASAQTAASGVLKAAWLPKALATKWLLAGAVAASSVGGYVALRPTRAPEARAPVTVVRSADTPHPRTATPPSEAAADEATDAEVTTAAPSEPRPAVRTHHARVAPERLLAESKLLAAARAALRADALDESESLLRKLEQQFPRGELRQERDVLQIEVLFARKARSTAEQRAHAFIARHPESPHSATLRRMLSAP